MGLDFRGLNNTLDKALRRKQQQDDLKLEIMAAQAGMPINSGRMWDTPQSRQTIAMNNMQNMRQEAQGYELDRLRTQNQGQLDVANVNNQAELQKTGMLESGVNRRFGVSAGLEYGKLGLERNKESFNQFATLSGLQGQGGNDMMGVQIGVDPATVESRQKMLQSFLGGGSSGGSPALGNSPFTLSGGQSSGGSTASITRADGRKINFGLDGRDAAVPIYDKKPQAQSNPMQDYVTRLYETPAAQAAQTQGKPKTKPQAQRATPNTSNVSPITPTPSSPTIFREFNFDPEKKKKVYPRAGSGNMWSPRP